MALTVEDNTGLAAADSYVSVAEFRAYATNRGIEAVGDLSDDEAEQKLRQGFDYVNSQWRYTSVPKTNDQAGEFPRVDLSDGMGRVFNTVPNRVKQAQCAAAIEAISGPLFVTAERGGKVKSESVGPISVTYEDGAPVGKTISEVERLLAPFIKSDAEPRRMVPFYNATNNDPEKPVFSVGMDDDPGVGEDE
jgi:hypothetical protein